MNIENQTARTRFENSERMYNECFEKHLDAGVEFISRTCICIDSDVVIAAGATIMPGTILKGNTVIGTGSVIGPNSFLEDTIIGDNVSFAQSVGRNSSVADGSQIGPFVQLRPDSIIGKNVHIGDFVEVKNSTIGDGTAVAHLTYIGDADIGKHCNFGCGVVIVNYDGEIKSRTTVGDYCFIGCNTNLVAPVKLGNGAYTAAGSTITDDVVAGSLAIARAKQVNKEGWAESKLSAYMAKKQKNSG